MWIGRGLLRILVGASLGATLFLSPAGELSADTRVENAQQLFVQGVRYLRGGSRVMAATYFEKALEANRNFVEAMVALADVLAVDSSGVPFGDPGRNIRARDLYTRVLDLEPGRAHTRNNLAWLLIQVGENLDGAIGHAEFAVEAHPDNVAFLDTLAVGYCKRGDMKRAQKVLGRAMELAPDAAFLQQRKKKLCRASGRSK